jgi:hypothetical protein
MKTGPASMNDSRPENDCGLIISPQELTRIREACERRRRELEAAGMLLPLRNRVRSHTGRGRDC